MSEQTTSPAAAEGPPPPDTGAAQLADQLTPTEQLGAVAGAITQLPAGVKLTTNLDTLEKEKPGQPFWFQHGGQYFRLLEPDDVAFDDVVIVQERPQLMMHILLDPQQAGAYFDLVKTTPMTVGKMKQLVKDYTKHFGLTDLGELGGSARS